MNKAQHTPTPWLSLTKKGMVTHIYSANGYCICTPNLIFKGDAKLALEESFANINLISAAPELLKVLEMINESGCTLPDRITDKMMHAINKAKNNN